jgi:hypothetical protein
MENLHLTFYTRHGTIVFAGRNNISHKIVHLFCFLWQALLLRVQSFQFLSLDGFPWCVQFYPQSSEMLTSEQEV